jgi:hypothetical protein
MTLILPKWQVEWLDKQRGRVSRQTLIVQIIQRQIEATDSHLGENNERTNRDEGVPHI